MSNELFIEVTVEEQELVSGGIDAAYGSAYSVLATTTKVLGPVAATNGANGSTFSFGGALDASTLAITSTVVAGIHI
ncbi:MAG: CTB family bacteriocin [Aulosira sp. ZfuCHP01]|nr:CTB family bacteriocin [Aulosira sp. DedVER01a]MDZ8053118.1 CTB family bacteriocin [Aulosira sp. ZfuCHP01]